MHHSTPSPADFKINWRTLSFSREIEEEFRQDRFRKSLNQIRAGLLLGMLFYGLFGILDYLLFPESIVTFWVIRYAIVLPYTAAVYLFSYSGKFGKFASAASASVILLGGLGITTMMMLIPSAGSAIYYVGLILVIIFGYTIFKIRFVWATLAGWMIVVAYEITAIWLSDTPVSAIITNNFFFLAGNMIGMFASYSIESGIRREYVKTYLLEAEKGKVDTLNRELESRVEERARQLIQANDDLRKEMVERREAEEKFRSLFERSKDAVFITTPEGKFVDINPAGIEMLGYDSKEEVLEIEIARDLYVSPDDRRRFQSLMEKHGHVKDLEFLCKRRDGREISVLETATTVHDENGNICYYQGIMRDVTEKKELERQLIQAQKMESLGTLAGGIAHDLNNVLTPIRLSIHLLRDKLTSDKAKPLLETMESNLNRGADIVKQVLTFARRTDAEFTPLSPERLVGEVMNIIEHTFPKDIAVETRVEDDLPSLKGNSTQLHQVLLNLCLNARDAMPEGGLLSIRTESVTIDERSAEAHARLEPGQYVRISVSDDGMGMPPHVLERIFEPFFTTKEVGKGTGLGLSVIHSIVEGHGGTVETQSEVNKGSTFSVYLPVEPAAEGESVERARQDLPRGDHELVLVVDDEESIRILIKQILETYDYDVLTASNGIEAMELFREHQSRIKCIMTDMLMPDLNGPATIRAIREIDATVPIIAMSGLATEEDGLGDGFDRAVQATVSKPFSAPVLLKTVRSVLGSIPG